MRQNPHILVLAYVYPPDAGSGTFRTLHLMNNLSKRGFEISVITTKISDFHSEANIDEKLITKIYPDIKVIRCSVKRPLSFLINIKKNYFEKGNETNENDNNLKRLIDNNSDKSRKGFFVLLKDMISDLLTCPDQHVGWIPDVLKNGSKIIREKKTDCIFATGGPWSCVLAGALLHKMTGVPLILDFQDPWVSNPNINNKNIFFKIILKKMEAFVIKSGTALIANTEESRNDLMERYTCLNNKNTYTITNGYDKSEKEIVSKKANCFSIVHTGELYLSRNPANLLEAVITLIKNNEIDKELFRIKFIGGISINDSKLTELLQSKYLENVIEFYPRVPHDEVLSFQVNADVLLLIQPEFPLQIPGKLYEYISLLKPMLAITEEHSATGNIIRNNDLGVVVEDRTTSIKNAVKEMYTQWVKNQQSSLKYENVVKFDYENLAQKLEIVINEITEN
jgi:glycosyltransferase involved in cell wall biosynthesis